MWISNISWYCFKISWTGSFKSMVIFTLMSPVRVSCSNYHGNRYVKCSTCLQSTCRQDCEKQRLTNQSIKVSTIHAIKTFFSHLARKHNSFIFFFNNVLLIIILQEINNCHVFLWYCMTKYHMVFILCDINY